MQLRKISIVLLALLLAAMAMVPYVSAEESYSLDNQNLDLIEANYIHEGTALELADITMKNMIQSELLNSDWNGVTIGKEPQIIYDINGKKLFYQFIVKNGEKNVGQVLTPASKVLGSSIQQIGDPNNLDYSTIQKTANGIAASESEGYIIQSSKVIAYSYPKMGVMVQLYNPQLKSQKTEIFDAGDFSVIPEKKPSFDGEPGIWSYYDEISRADMIENVAHWNTQVSTIKGLSTKATGEANYIQYFPTTNQDYSEWCAIATAWLITSFHHPGTSQTQTSVANHMGVYSNTGPTWNNEIQYYLDSYASGGMGKPYSFTDYWTSSPQDITYSMIKTEIDANRPLKIGHNGHARACIGYWQYTSGDHLFKFSDPWPDASKTYWESPPNPASSITGYQNYIIAQ